jgi:2-methylcitrate dehydratase PrpD
MSVTKKLAEYAASGTFNDLPDEVVEHTKVCVLNILGAAIGGIETRVGQMHVNLAKQTGGGIAEATLLGDGTKVSTAMATYANASLAFALDYEDVVCYCIHAGPVTIPAAMAVGELVNANGRDLIIAIERGYEIGTRIGNSMQPSAERGAQVWGQQYTPFAPCIAASHLLGLNADETEVAMGIAGTYATVPSAYKYFGVVEDTRPMREAKLGWGWMALGGTFAAISAKEGFRGGHGILDGNEGFWIMAGSDRCDHDIMVNNIGQTHYILETEFKVHPSIAWNHPVHIGLLKMQSEHNFTADDVDSVRVKGLGAERIADYKPAGEVDAMFSLPYTIATTLLGDELVPAMYSQERISSKDVGEMLGKIKIEADEKAELAWFNEGRMCFDIYIKLKDGRELHENAEFSRDKPDLGKNEIEAKFRQLARQVLSQDKIDKVVDTVNHLEELDHVSSLTNLLVPG